MAESQEHFTLSSINNNKRKNQLPDNNLTCKKRFAMVTPESTDETTLTSTTNEEQRQAYSAALHTRLYEAKFAYAYNPEHGFEPYWPGGDYKIIDPTAETYKTPHVKIKNRGKYVPRYITRSTAPTRMVCGDICLYPSIKEVCTHHTESNEWAGCWKHPPAWPSANKHCWGEPPDVLVNPFHEFPSYCDYLAATCRDHFTKARYVLIHIGKCKTVDDWFKPMRDHTEVLERLTQYPLMDMKRLTRNTPDPIANIITRTPRRTNRTKYSSNFVTDFPVSFPSP